MATPEYQRLRDQAWKDYLKALTPEQKKLQKKAAELDRLWGKMVAAGTRRALRRRHHEAINKLIALANFN